MASVLVAGQAGAVAAASAGASSAGHTPRTGRTQAPLTTAQAAKLSRNLTQHVIVLLRHQPAVPAAGAAVLLPSAMSSRSAAIARSQSGVVHELSQVHARHVIGYRLVNALAATVSPGEEARLKANPAVAQVIPDALIQGPSATVQPQSTPAAKIAPLPGACLPHGGVQLEPEALQLTGTQSRNPATPTARKLGFTGAGVTVAYIADGIDIHNVNFIRRNGKSVFVDYKDFTGDGINVSSGGGGEAFLDANSIAGQGRQVYNVQSFGPQTLTQTCNIRIEGVAPGARIVGLRVFGVNNFTTTSAFLDAINYATVVHPVNVLNESFGGNAIPDTSLDAIKQFDDAAVAAGITVVVSSGDAAPGTNTIGSPATDPNVISVGASTAFRAYAMANFFEADKFAHTGWLDNNISAISSTGFNSFGAGVDVVAPGDATFTSCTAAPNAYPECMNDKGRPSPVQLTGGTSESSPLTAGAAALVIQAYRKTHGGSTPTPAVVKQTLMSAAADIGAAGADQGAGLINAYKAVELAESAGVAKKVGLTLRTRVTGVSGVNPAASRPGQIDIQGMPGTGQTATFRITNAGTSAQTVHLSSRTLSAPRYVSHFSVTLSNRRSGHFVDFVGFKDNFAELHFNVHAGQNRLNVAMSYPARGNTFSPASLILISPDGKFAANSLPQGLSQDANLQVTNPRAGRWTAVVFSPMGGNPGFGVTGEIRFTTSTQRFVSFGTLSASSVRLARGASASVIYRVSTPGSPGDQTGSVVVNGGHGATTIPVMLRSYVNAAAPGGGSFSGRVSGGNGRGPGQFAYYQFQVGPGSPAITATLKLANDPSNMVETFLVDPSGQIDGYGSNYRAVSNQAFTDGLTADAFAINAIPGTWELVAEFVDPTGGNETSDGYTGHISLTAGASVSGQPTGASIPVGTSQAFNVQVTNNGNTTEDVFLDPRLNAADVPEPLLPLNGVDTNTVRVPMNSSVGAPPEWLVPTESSSVTTQVTVAPIAPTTAAFPFTYDLSPFLGDPDVASISPGSVGGSASPPPLTVAASSGPVTPGGWIALPAPAAQDGFTSADTQAENATFAASVQTQPFDTTVDSSVGSTHIGDYWLTAVDPAATSDVTLGIAPGQTVTFTVTITVPSTATVGSTVNGVLYVDDYAQILTGQIAGSELAAVPYSYTVTS